MLQQQDAPDHQLKGCDEIRGPIILQREIDRARETCCGWPRPNRASYRECPGAGPQGMRCKPAGHRPRRCRRRASRQCLRGAFGIFKAQGDGLVAPRVVEDVAAIGGENQLITEAIGRLGEGPRLIAGGGADEQKPWGHTGNYCLLVGPLLLWLRFRTLLRCLTGRRSRTSLRCRLRWRGRSSLRRRLRGRSRTSLRLRSLRWWFRSSYRRGTLRWRFWTSCGCGRWGGGCGRATGAGRCGGACGRACGCARCGGGSGRATGAVVVVVLRAEPTGLRSLRWCFRPGYRRGALGCFLANLRNRSLRWCFRPSYRRGTLGWFLASLRNRTGRFLRSWRHRFSRDIGSRLGTRLLRRNRLRHGLWSRLRHRRRTLELLWTSGLRRSSGLNRLLGRSRGAVAGIVAGRVWRLSGLRCWARDLAPIRIYWARSWRCILRGTYRGSRRARGWSPVLRRKRPIDHQRRRPALTSGCNKLRAIGRGFTRMLDLRVHGWSPRIVHHGCFLRSGSGINAAAATVITGANAIILDRIVVDVMNAGSVYVRDRRVVVDAIVVPVGAVIAAARVAIAVVDAAVVSHVTAPVAGMPEITSVVISPPRRRPERANPGSQYPSPGNPIISGGCVIPVAGVPQVIITRSWGLVIFGQRRRRLAGLDVLIIVRSLLRVWIVTLILGVVVLIAGRVIVLIARRIVALIARRIVVLIARRIVALIARRRVVGSLRRGGRRFGRRRRRLVSRREVGIGRIPIGILGSRILDLIAGT